MSELMEKNLNYNEESILNGLNEALSFAKGKNSDVVIHEVFVKDIDSQSLLNDELHD